MRMDRRRKKTIQHGKAANSRSSWNWFFGAALLAVTFCAYQPAWNGKPIFDDVMYLTNTVELRSFSGLAHLWTEPQTTRQYHPLLDTVFWVEDKLWGDSMLGYHLVNILIHAVAALLLLKILRQLRIPGAWLACTIFALHPIQAESVAWLSELKNTLSGIFLFASVLVYLRFDQDRSARSYTLVLLLFSLGLMVKAIVAILPAAVLIAIWWKREKLEWKRDVVPLIPFLVLGIAAGIFTAWMEREFAGAKGEAFDFSPIERLLIAGRAFWFYIGKLFWPANLVLIYPRWNVDASVWWQYLFPVAALGFYVFAWAFRRQWRWLLAGPLFFGVAIFPMLGFFNISFFRLSFVADHFQYIPSIGIIIPVSAGLAVLLTRWHGWHRTAGFAFCFALLAALTVLTWNQSHMFRDAETCYRTVIEKNPQSWEAYIEIGRALFDKGLLDQASTHFQKALEISPNDPSSKKRAYNSLGNVLLKEGRVDEAISDFEKALESDPNYAAAHTSLGSAYHRKGRLKESIVHYQKSLALLPRAASAHNNLAWMLATCSDPSLRNGPQALALAQRANNLSNGSNPAFLRSLAAAYAENGQFSEAIETAQRALQFSSKTTRRDLAQAIQNELKLYQAASPYHETERH
jgi:tetratricopeptide (TPR) repeat protein